MDVVGKVLCFGWEEGYLGGRLPKERSGALRGGTRGNLKCEVREECREGLVCRL